MFVKAIQELTDNQAVDKETIQEISEVNQITLKFWNISFLPHFVKSKDIITYVHEKWEFIRL